MRVGLCARVTVLELLTCSGLVGNVANLGQKFTYNIKINTYVLATDHT